MRSRIGNLALLLPLLLLRCEATRSTSTSATNGGRNNVARDLFEKTLLNLMYQRRMFMEGFGNATEALQKGYEFDGSVEVEETGEGRGRRKRLKQMNRTLMAIVMAYTLKFIFLIPTFVGTLILLKFTTAVAGFFYSLFAAILGLDHHHYRH